MSYSPLPTVRQGNGVLAKAIGPLFADSIFPLLPKTALVPDLSTNNPQLNLSVCCARTIKADRKTGGLVILEEELATHDGVGHQRHPGARLQVRTAAQHVNSVAGFTAAMHARRPSFLVKGNLGWGF